MKPFLYKEQGLKLLFKLYKRQRIEPLLQALWNKFIHNLFLKIMAECMTRLKK